jgi:hypothetical protein
MVDAAREMNGRELFELCRRWIDTSRRPTDPKKRNAVDRAVAALKDQTKIVVEPAEPLPAGLVSIFDVWDRTKLSDDQLRSELQAPDPLVRARALFLGAKRGLVADDVLRAKAGSEDWPERLVAALNGLHPAAANDHVSWITACAGQDAGTQQAPVRCGVDEFERAETQLAELRKKATPWARRMAGELQALQAFRMVFAEGEITILADDSATIKGAAQKGGDATRKDIDDAFGGGKKRKK